MDFTLSPRDRDFSGRIRHFMDEEVRPQRTAYLQEQLSGDRWRPLDVIEDLKAKAKLASLWKLFMPPAPAGPERDAAFTFIGERLSNVEYALCAEEMGRVAWASEVFNRSAPDTGNMEVLHRYGTTPQKDAWLTPLMDGRIRSAFLMTEPDVASSDATNIRTSIRREGDHYIIKGRKWWSSGAADPRCKLAIVMGKTNPDAKRIANSRCSCST